MVCASNERNIYTLFLLFIFLHTRTPYMNILCMECNLYGETVIIQMKKKKETVSLNRIYCIHTCVSY